MHVLGTPPAFILSQDRTLELKFFDFCARGRSELSFLHNIVSLCLARLPGAYLTSLWFPHTLFPMGLATAAGSLVSVIICLIAYRVITRKDRPAPAAA